MPLLIVTLKLVRWITMNTWDVRKVRIDFDKKKSE